MLVRHPKPAIRKWLKRGALVALVVEGAAFAVSYFGWSKANRDPGSQLHLLANSKNFTRLKCIDLSDNDICSLKETMECLANLKSLTAFSLEGNPCSVMPEYSKMIVQYLPNIQYLDATEILDFDRENIRPLDSDHIDPQVYFQCYRILGLPEPPKDKKNIQTIHIEVNFPLLVDTSAVEEAPQNQEMQLSNEMLMANISDGNDVPSKKEKKKASKLNNNIKKNKDKKPKKGRKKSYYTRENEYDAEFEKRNVWYKTEKMPWSKIIQFPSILVKDCNINLIKIRDTFRSIVPIRIVYLKVDPHSNKRKKHQGKGKDGKKGRKPPINPSEAPEESHVETVLKKITIASFYCELRSINWSDESMDFYWADHPDMGERALPVEGSLKILEYKINSTPKKIKKSSKVKERTDEHGPKVEYLPAVLTCQVGFSLSRF